MNTPDPCSNCKHLYADCMREDDPSYMAECKLITFSDTGRKPKWASGDCPRFESFRPEDIMPHDANCIMRSCTGCGPESEKGKLKKELAKECQKNATLLDEINKVKEQLVKAQQRLNEMEE